MTTSKQHAAKSFDKNTLDLLSVKIVLKTDIFNKSMVQ